MLTGGVDTLISILLAITHAILLLRTIRATLSCFCVGIQDGNLPFTIILAMVVG